MTKSSMKSLVCSWQALRLLVLLRPIWSCILNSNQNCAENSSERSTQRWSPWKMISWESWPWSILKSWAILGSVTSRRLESKLLWFTQIHLASTKMWLFKGWLIKLSKIQLLLRLTICSMIPPSGKSHIGSSRNDSTPNQNSTNARMAEWDTPWLFVLFMAGNVSVSGNPLLSWWSASRYRFSCSNMRSDWWTIRTWLINHQWIHLGHLNQSSSAK